jgi:lysozyme family protein
VIDEILDEIIKAEGSRYTNRPNDRGGPTKYGVTLKAYRDYVDENATELTIRNLTEAEARAFYNRFYITEPKFDKIHPLVMPLVVDCGVNHGQKRAAKWFQKAVGATEDGVIGPKTLEAARDVPSTVIYLSICAYRIRFYGAIVNRDHSQAEFISGWNNRAAKFILGLADLLKDQ